MIAEWLFSNYYLYPVKLNHSASLNLSTMSLVNSNGPSIVLPINNIRARPPTLSDFAIIPMSLFFIILGMSSSLMLEEPMELPFPARHFKKP